MNKVIKKNASMIDHCQKNNKMLINPKWRTSRKLWRKKVKFQSLLIPTFFSRVISSVTHVSSNQVSLPHPHGNSQNYSALKILTHMDLKKLELETKGEIGSRRKIWMN